MNIEPVQFEHIPVGEPLPFALVDKTGVLLARKGYVIPSRKELEETAERGGGLFIDTVHSAAHYRTYLEHLNKMLLQDKSLGEIAQTHIESLQANDRTLEKLEQLGWLDLQVMANNTLRESNSEFFRSRLEQMNQILQRHLRRNPDGALFALIYLSSTGLEYYSATHGMLVGCMCHLAARNVLGWSEDDCNLVMRVGLTMNVGMTVLQDRLALQTEPLSTVQKNAIAAHATVSADILERMGVPDADWLEAVRLHHQQAPGKLSERSRANRVARLIQRADMFGARLAPRASRHPLPPAQAMQATYYDENKQVDEAGAALIKAVGIYQPGSLVRLATGEIAVVIQRGANTTTPRVAVLVNKAGMPTAEPIVRDTAFNDFRITASIAHRDIKVQINLERILLLTATGAPMNLR
ncbi:phosphohydrolase [Curvibacter sp. CHRR-16]|uniref:HD-GYP domain-containing protein n=1 Tax=Curvibacter sp. CHRR-16 TaxID=2835872 RepID=UPI001BDA8144|nr:phosphohydrolase [Curvibacter sp. CHRR-16]MBT0570425.1 phosphohydrolase [Curvibacter sp. CHRR-16]